MWHLFLGNFLSWIASFQNIQGAFLESQLVKNLQCRRPQLNSWVRKFPWRRVGITTPVTLCFPGASDSKGSAWNAGDLGLIPGLGRSPGEGKDYLLQYSGLENIYSPWGPKESDTTEQLYFTCILTPLNCFCTSVKNQLDILCGFFWVLSSIPRIFVLSPSPVLHCLDCCGYVVSLNIEESDFSHFLFSKLF